MEVARLELTPQIPTFASMDVSAANTADNKANTNHIKSPLIHITQFLFHPIYFIRIAHRMKQKSYRAAAYARKGDNRKTCADD
jgi:hypothetical protein